MKREDMMKQPIRGYRIAPHYRKVEVFDFCSITKALMAVHTCVPNKGLSKLERYNECRRFLADYGINIGTP